MRSRSPSIGGREGSRHGVGGGDGGGAWPVPGQSQAIGARAQKARFEVLDRLVHFGVGLSPQQRNDWPWFKEAWDEAMVAEHGGNWASVFSGWVQHVLDDERRNAFSEFVYNETCRVLAGNAALQVPGS